MNSAHLHLIINHFPIFGIILGVIFIILFLFKRNDYFITIGLVVLVITGLITIPTFTTGEGAEETLKHLSGIEEFRIEKHEELAEKALILVEVIAAFSLICLFILKFKKKITDTLIILALILSAGCALLLSFVNNNGAQIRHTEIQNDKVVPQKYE